MMNIAKIAIFVAAALLPLGACAESPAEVAASPGTAVGSDLPPKVRGLLLQEMNAVLAATKNIVDALVRGQHEIVAQEAQAIHDSFIMQQEMTPADKQALMGAVPKAFLERDQAFHQVSARLAAAARESDTGQQQKLFSEMVNACVECHSAHAIDRFPALR